MKKYIIVTEKEYRIHEADSVTQAMDIIYRLYPEETIVYVGLLEFQHPDYAE